MWRQPSSYRDTWPNGVERKMYGGVPAGKGQYYVGVTIFDAGDGRRITDADVSARVQGIDFGASPTRLEPIKLDQAPPYYGNFFPTASTRSYCMEIDIGRDASQGEPVRVTFEYSHPPR